jgi:Tol biopolymer transport system component
MKKICSVMFHLLAIFGLFGCTMEVSQPSTATPLAEVSSPASTAPAPNTNHTTRPSGTTVPITWSDLHLSGKLIYSTISGNEGKAAPEIQMLDLATGEITTIFASSDNAWIYYLAVSPDAKKLVMSYTPPSQPGSDSGTSLYILPLEEAAAPQILFTPPTPSDRYIQVEWSPDGKYLYFVHYNHEDQPANQPFPDYQISRMAYPGGQAERILEHAFWPRVSPDSSKLVYVTLDPVSGASELFLSNADGSGPQQIRFSGVPEIIDAPSFAPDSTSILFSAPDVAQAYQPNWLDRLMGVQIAKAHNVPSDWWSVPISGGDVTRLTQIQTIKLFASISPDGKYIASLSGEGIFVMSPDGSNLRQLLLDPGVSGTLRWIP